MPRLSLPHICLCFLALVLVWGASGCSSTPDPSPSSTPAPTPDFVSPTPESTDLPSDTVRLRKTTIKTRQGQKWEMEADEVDWMDDRARAKARAVTWWLVDKDDKKWVKVVSPEADIDMEGEVVTFTGETVATRLGFPESLKVKKLVYKGKDRKFYGSGGVLWQRANIELTGETLTATAELDKVQLKGRVKGKSIGGFEGLKEPQKAD